MHKCTKSFSAFLQGILSRTPIDSGCIAGYMTSHVTIGQSSARAHPWLLQRLPGLFVARGALVCRSLHPHCLQ